MKTAIEISEHQISNLRLGQEISIVRKEAREYAETFAQVREFILLKHERDDYDGIVTERVDREIDKYDVQMILKVKLV